LNILLLFRINGRYHARKKILTGICLLGIALGVGVIIAVDLANQCALTSFSSALDHLSGRATHSLVPTGKQIPESVFTRIIRTPGVIAASPVIKRLAFADEIPDAPLQFLGIDPLLDFPFRAVSPGIKKENAWREFLTTPDGVLVSPDLAGRHGLKAGDGLTVRVGVKRKSVTVLGLIDPGSGGDLEPNLVLADIATAQEIFDLPGSLDQIDLILDPRAGGLAGGLPPSVTLTTARGMKEAAAGMLRAFSFNLTSLSLLALFVGVFLIYNTMMFSVIQRQQQMAVLRCLGATRGEILGAFILEALVMGVIGCILGWLVGYAMAQFTVKSVASTIADHYFYLRVNRVLLDPAVFFKGALVGLLVTAAGALYPALEVFSVQPVEAVKRRTPEDRILKLKFRLFLIGIAVFILSVLLIFASGDSMRLGLVAATAMTFGFAAMVPQAVYLLSRIFRPVMKKLFGLKGGMAVKGISAALSRTGTAIAALMVALTMAISVDIMIGSFRKTLVIWLDGTLMGDLYMGHADKHFGQYSLPESIQDDLEADPRIDAVDAYSLFGMTFREQKTYLMVVNADVLKTRTRFQFMAHTGPPWTAVSEGAVMISEPFMRKFNVHAGDRLTLATPSGPLDVEVCAVFRDYTSNLGTLIIDRGVYNRHWKENTIMSYSVFLKPGVPAEGVIADLYAAYPDLHLRIVSNRDYKLRALRIFDKTFALTYSLKILAIVVACLAVISTLMAFLLEKRREFSMLHALGMRIREIHSLQFLQALVLSAFAVILGLVSGSVLSWVLIYVINLRSFGWSVDYHFVYGLLWKIPFIVIMAAAAACIYPVIRMAPDKISLNIRNE
jgi:putative ABC transport system permease protein